MWYAERVDHHRAADRPPHLDDGPALLEAPLRLGVADDFAQPPRGRALGVIVVYALDRRPVALSLGRTNFRKSSQTRHPAQHSRDEEHRRGEAERSK